MGIIFTINIVKGIKSDNSFWMEQTSSFLTFIMGIAITKMELRFIIMIFSLAVILLLGLEYKEEGKTLVLLMISVYCSNIIMMIMGIDIGYHLCILLIVIIDFKYSGKKILLNRFMDVISVVGYCYLNVLIQ